MAPPTYDQIVARNIRSARARLGPLGQESLAKRMRALGYSSWLRQTVSSTEKGRRRVSAEEIFGLALALQTTISGLMTALGDDEGVALPGGVLSFKSVEQLATGRNDHSVEWVDDEPVYSDGVRATWGTFPGVGKTVDDVLDKSREAED
jgi:transcriptional regulator with XRE-family HTH domain